MATAGRRSRDSFLPPEIPGSANAGGGTARLVRDFHFHDTENVASSLRRQLHLSAAFDRALSELLELYRDRHNSVAGPVGTDLSLAGVLSCQVFLFLLMFYRFCF